MTTLDTLLDQAWRTMMALPPGSSEHHAAYERYARLKEVEGGDTARMEDALASCRMEDWLPLDRVL